MTAGTVLRRVRAVLLLAVAALVAAGLVSGATSSPDQGTTSPQLQPTADTSQFRAGNIISDNLFFDGGAMTAYQVQDFLNAKGANCRAGAMPCLKNYTEGTWNRPADAYCNGYAGAPGETSAWIIAKVGASCGISQRVLLVLLQKEQGLLTASGSSLTTTRYQKATGYGCPDTAPCDAQYYGFYNQVWNAARKYKVYVANFDDYNYGPFRWNTIQYSPTASCGSSSVYIENNATAALYIYTPYQPNAGALAAGYGTAACGAYGNRNFWLYYTDYFGSTQSPGGNAIVTRSAAAPPALGAATTGVVCGLRDAGCFQSYQGGSVYWSPATGAQIIWGAIRDRWAALGWEGSKLGYPTREEVCGLANGGCLQFFQYGGIYYSPASGAHSVVGAISDKWVATGLETGPLGYPTTEEACGLAGGGCFQAYQGAPIYYSPATGAHPVDEPVLPVWTASGYETGSLGYPTSDTSCGLRDSGCYQFFAKGAVYSSATNGTRTVSGDVLAKWSQTGFESGALGYPTGNTTCGLRDGGCTNTFENGTIAWSKGTGAHVLTGGALDRWTTTSAQDGALGYPTTDTACGLPDTGCATGFQTGTVYDSASTDPVRVTGAIGVRYDANGKQASTLGYPTADEFCGLAGAGCGQEFQNGVVYWSGPTGAHAVTGTVLTEWARVGTQPGRIGYPTGELTCGLRSSGCKQTFALGTVYTSSAGTRTVWGAISDAWTARGAQDGVFGYPTGPEVCGLTGGGCKQDFQGGTIYWSPATGAFPVGGLIGAAWTTLGAESGAIGYPTRGEACGLVRGGCFQFFQNAGIYWSPATGAHPISGPIADAWGAAGFERGTLGYPKTDPVTAGNETTQQFEGGTLVLDRTTNRVTRR